MKKVVLILLAIMILPLVLAIMPVPDQNSFGQDQYYGVVFDKEGEAAVAAKITYYNSGSEDINEVVIELPGTNHRMVSILQEYYVKEKRCSYWEEVCFKTDSNGFCEEFKKQCNNWYEYQVYPPYYYSLKSDKEELSNSVKYTIKLEKPIKSQESGSVILYYKSKDYVESSFGVYRFGFETLKIPYDTKSMTVAVDVVDDLKMSDTNSQTQYLDVSYDKAASFAVGEGAQSDELYRFSNNIGYNGQRLETTSNLDPWESFKVTGKYSSSWFNLHKGSILIWVLVALVVIGGAVLLIKKGLKKQTSPALRIIGTSLVSTIVLGGLWFLAKVLYDFVRNNLYYQYSSLVGILIITLTVILSLAIWIVPAVFIGMKYGVKEGIWTVIATIGFTLILVVIAMIIIFSLKQNPGPVYYGGAMVKDAITAGAAE
ncbi:MAG: hypothetical protein PHT54_02600 [Candidatus Nanoarchaeia archaeon]|nr:hypothetical protein [Candidatus Nanoarchaeia archaeon]